MGLFNVIGRASLAAGVPEDVTQVVANLDAIAAILNGGIDNSNINAAAAIDYSKLNVLDLAIPVTKEAAQPYCSVDQAAAISLGNALNNQYILWGTEIVDDFGMHDAVNPVRITCPTPGLYIAIATVVFAPSAAGDRTTIIQNQAGVRLNGQSVPSAGAALSTDVQAVAIERKNTGEYFLVEAFQNSGAALNAVTSDGGRGVVANFTVARIGSR